MTVLPMRKRLMDPVFTKQTCPFAAGLSPSKKTLNLVFSTGGGRAISSLDFRCQSQDAVVGFDSTEVRGSRRC